MFFKGPFKPIILICVSDKNILVLSKPLRRKALRAVLTTLTPEQEIHCNTWTKQRPVRPFNPLLLPRYINPMH